MASARPGAQSCAAAATGPSATVPARNVSRLRLSYLALLWFIPNVTRYTRDMSSDIRREIVERVIARRGRLHLFDSLDAKKSALVVIDMQNAFVAPGAPMEVPAARGIVATINRLAAALRKRGVPVIWIAHENARDGRDWAGFFDAFIAPGRRADASAALAAGSPLQKLWPELDIQPGDLRIGKN